MPQMPSRIAKGPILSYFDRVMNNSGKPPGDVAKSLKTALETSTGTPLDQILGTEFSIPSTHVYLDHLDDHWFDPYTGWWASQQPIDPIIRQGLIEVCDLVIHASQENPPRVLPIDTYWICAEGPVEVWICMPKTHLTVHIVTPPIYARPTPAATMAEPIYMVRRAGPTVGENLVRLSMPLPNQPICTLQPRNEPPVPIP